MGKIRQYVIISKNLELFPFTPNIRKLEKSNIRLLTIASNTFIALPAIQQQKLQLLFSLLHMQIYWTVKLFFFIVFVSFLVSLRLFFIAIYKFPIYPIFNHCPSRCLDQGSNIVEHRRNYKIFQHFLIFFRPFKF